MSYILRSVVALVLGLVVFFGFLFLLLISNMSDKLVDSEFYSDTISEQDTYNRIYDEVLVDPELEPTTRDLLGDFQVVDQAEVVELLKEIIPPSYLQSQVENTIQGSVDYFNEELESLELHIELGPPLDRIKPALFGYIDQRLDNLAEEDLGDLECAPQTVQDVSERYQERWDQLAAGVVPENVPSLNAFDRACRRTIFQVAFDEAVQASTLDDRAKQGLLEQRPPIEQAFIDGDTHGALKLAARPIATPLMDDAILRIRGELDEGDRLDLISQVVAWNDSITEPELRSSVENTRDWVNWGRKFGKAAALAMLIGGSLLLGLVHYPSLSNGVRWPGLTLLLTGVVFFAGAKVLESQLPDRLRDLVGLGASEISGVPQSAIDLAGDLLVSFGTQLTGGMAALSLIILIIGAVAFASSFFIDYAILLHKLVSISLKVLRLPLRLLKPGNGAAPGGS